MRTFVGFDRISTDPEILGGKPHVRGTRIGLERALEVLAQYREPAAPESDFPGLDQEAVRQVLEFAAAEVGGRRIPLERSEPV